MRGVLPSLAIQCGTVSSYHLRGRGALPPLVIQCGTVSSYHLRGRGALPLSATRRVAARCGRAHPSAKRKEDPPGKTQTVAPNADAPMCCASRAVPTPMAPAITCSPGAPPFRRCRCIGMSAAAIPKRGSTAPTSPGWKKSTAKLSFPAAKRPSKRKNGAKIAPFCFALFWPFSLWPVRGCVWPLPPAGGRFPPSWAFWPALRPVRR